MPPRNNLNLSSLPSRQDNQPVVSTPVVSNWRQQALARDWAMAQDPRFQELSPYMQDIILKDQYGPNFVFYPGQSMVNRQGQVVWDDSLDANGFRILAAQHPDWNYSPIGDTVICEGSPLLEGKLFSPPEINWLTEMG